jgi:streptomycin 6-kinase
MEHYRPHPRANNLMALKIPVRVVANCSKTPEGAAWLDRLPEILRGVERRWSLSVAAPFDNSEVSCAWVAPAALADGTEAVLKIGTPHWEAEHEAKGLRFWDGDPTVRLLAVDDELGAMLLERCLPGTSLRVVPEVEQDVIIAKLLRRLWRSPVAPHPFRPLSALTKFWSDETVPSKKSWRDAGLVREGLRLMQELPRTAPREVLLATDLHAGNILRSNREPWLVIDPKPFMGDPAYDVTQHLFNCSERLRSDPIGLIHRMGDLVGVDHERIRLWTFARVAADPPDDWSYEEWIAIARATAP